MASYRKHHVRTKVKRIKPKKKLFKRPFFWVLILALLFVLTDAYFLFFYSGFQIENIVISGNNKIQLQDLNNFAMDNINTGLINFLGIKASTKSIFLLNPDKLSEQIIEKFPNAKEVEVTKSFPKQIFIKISEREPMGIYCSNDIINPLCFLIDEEGIIFEQFSEGGEPLTIIKNTNNNSELILGKKMLEVEVAMAISAIQNSLKENFGINLAETFVTSPLRLNVKTSENWEIYFNLGKDSSIDSQLVKLSLILNDEIPQESRHKIQYIDLRFKDRAFYK